jgi:hypothetical protein
VHLVDDVDLELPLRRRVTHRFAQLTHLVDAIVGCAVNFDHVEMRSLGDRLAGRILDVEIRVGSIRAIQRFGEDSRGRGLSRAARADEQIGMRDPLARDRILQRAHNVVLAHNVIKRLRPPFARDYLVGRGQAVVMKMKVEK